ncbi:hypothetical protein IWW48_005815 [Coemansia sp. RSA 1200]|nr:hypothetical protein IWW48_005815 [Coemansia sp. RSA 1200]
MVPSVIAAHGPSDSDVHKQHATSTGAVAKLISEELDNALSPLSSSTITIASLGSSLGLANVGGKLGSSHAKGYDMAGVATDREEGPGSSSNSSSSSSSSVRSSRTTSPGMAATDDGGSSTEAAADTESSPSVKAIGGDDDTYSRRGTVEAAALALPASSRIISAKQKKASPAMRSISMDYTHAYASSIQTSPSSSSSSPPLPLPLPLGAPAFSSSHVNVVEVGKEVGRETADEAKSQPDEAAPSPSEESRTFFAQRLLGPLSKRKSIVLLLGIDSKKKDKKQQVAAGESKAEAKAKAETASKNKREAGDDDGETPTTTAAAEAEAEIEGETANSSPSQPRQKHKSRPKPKQQAQRSVPSKSLDLGRELLSQARGPFNRRAMQRTKGENAIYAGKGDAAGTAAAPAAAAAMGPARFQELPRSLAARLGFSSTLASKARRAGDLRFVITPHATLPEVVEVIDCEEMVPVYRKISRSGKSWHETFHEVDVEAEENEMARMSGALGVYGAAVDLDDANMMSEYDMAMALGLPYPGIANYYGSVSSNASSRPGSLRNSVPFGSAMPPVVAVNTASMYYSASAGGALSMAAPRGMAASASGAALSGHLGASASCATFQTMADDSESSGGGRRSEMPMALSNPSTTSFANGGTVRMGRASTSIGMLGGMLGSMSMYGSGSQAQHPLLSPAMRQQGLLWEALTPYPNQFPLHIKDSRRVIDTASLASLVLDRQNFCYRFQLGSTRMRWAAKRVKKSQLALECYVRGVLVAEIFVDYEKGYSPYNMPAKSADRKQKQKQGPESRIDEGSGASTPYSRTASDSSGNNYIYNSTDSSGSRSNVPEDGTYPMMTILSSAFTHLAALDEDIVESFIVFSGIQVLEFLHL